MTALEQVQETLSQSTALYPEGLSFADLGDTDGCPKWRLVTRVLGLSLSASLSAVPNPENRYGLIANGVADDIIAGD